MPGAQKRPLSRLTTIRHAGRHDRIQMSGESNEPPASAGPLSQQVSRRVDAHALQPQFAEAFGQVVRPRRLKKGRSRYFCQFDVDPVQPLSLFVQGPDNSLQAGKLQDFRQGGNLLSVGLAGEGRGIMHADNLLLLPGQTPSRETSEMLQTYPAGNGRGEVARQASAMPLRPDRACPSPGIRTAEQSSVFPELQRADTACDNARTDRSPHLLHTAA